MKDWSSEPNRVLRSFVLMKPQFILSFLFASLVFLSSCQKEDEPFEYPDDTITQPSTVTHMVREMEVENNWAFEYAADGCDTEFPVETFAQLEHSTTSGYISMFLVPNTEACDLFVSAATSFKEDEVPSDYWDNWRFELAFSELQLNDTSELRLELDYREVELSIDLADIMRERLAKDSVVSDTDGVIVLEFQEGFTNLFLNGIQWSPDLSAGSGNSFVKDATVTEPKFGLTILQGGTKNRSLIVFNYLRVTSYGIPEQDD